MKPGFLIINKDKNMTSFDVVREVKKKLATKKVGHTGTLDPNTTGLLIVAIGRATKMIPIISTDATKEYIATVKYGIKTDTQDITGEVIGIKEILIKTEDEIIEVLNTFLGSSMQTPPMYSAKKLDGKRAYDLAREGVDFKLKDQEIIISEIELINLTEDGFVFRAIVSKGTYIRSLIEDIADKLNNVATMSDLIRTKTDGFDIKDAIKLENVTDDKIVSLDSILLDKYKTVVTDSKIIKNGGKVEITESIYPVLYVDRENKPIAIYDKYNETEAKPKLML